MKKIVRVIFIYLVLCGIVSCGQSVSSGQTKSTLDLTLLDMDGAPFTFNSRRSAKVPIMLMFWTTWCPTCQTEIHSISKSYQEFRQDGLELILINVGEPATKVKKFLRQYNLPFRVLLDTDTSVAQSLGLLGVPTYILIDNKGYIVSTFHYFPKKEYKKLLAQ